MSTLSNGFKVATEATVVSELPLMLSWLLWASCDEPHTPAWLLQGPTATLGIYVDAGSVYEKPMQSGKSKRPDVS